MSKEKEKMTFKQWILLASVVIGGGNGLYFGIPVLLDLMQHQIDRIDVVIYLLCDKDQGCVNNALTHIFEQKNLREALSIHH